MDESLRGKLLIASPALLDPNFARSVVLMTEHSEDGAMGIVLNRPGDAIASELMPALEEIAGDDPLFIGGPVQPQAVVLLAEFADTAAAAWIVVADVGLASAEIRSLGFGGRGPPRALLRGLFGLGPRAARAGARDRLVDSRAASAVRALPGRPGFALERRARAEGRLLCARLADARRSEHELTGLPDLEEILPGLHRWTAEVADWTPDQGGPEGWAQEVACVAWEGEGALVLVDPLVEEGDWDAIDALVERHGGSVALVVTCPWHARSGGEAMRRYVNSPGVEAWAHSVAVRDGERIGFEVANVVSESTQVAPGVEVIATDTENGELTVWIEEIRAIVAADVLIGAEGERSETLRVCPEAWLEEANDVETVKAALRPFLEREIAAIVPLHGAPVLDNAQEALQRALA